MGGPQHKHVVLCINMWNTKTCKLCITHSSLNDDNRTSGICITLMLHFFVQRAAAYCTWGCKQVCQVSV